MQSITACNAITLVFIERKKKVGQYVKNTGRWECYQMKLVLNANEATLSIPTEVLLFKDVKQHQLRGSGHQNFDFDLCTFPSGKINRLPNILLTLRC